ncbi:MAG TPA: LysM peptidoglycan-binding domain-containing protein, partial [Usitatibacteraceae bacterium]|nr:LysM peptidoglycan-binding domain-containing protein [Usitatibacteraceae bacterium]
MDADEFAALNPASNRPVAATSTGYFLVPAEKADVFRENLELYRTVQGPMVSWQVIHAKRGESLDTLARRYGMTASYLRATGGPFREKKGKLTQPASFMVPVGKDARAIESALEKKVALKNDRKDTSVEAAAPAGPASVAAASAALVLDSDRQPGQPAPATQPAVDPALPVTHVVQRGETLFSIARQYGMSVAELQARNPLRGPNLPAGKILSIAGDAAAADAQVRVAASAAPQRDTRPAVHVVRSGETLFAIATRYGVQLGDLLRWNRLTARSVIQPGGRIRLQG